MSKKKSKSLNNPETKEKNEGTEQHTSNNQEQSEQKVTETTSMNNKTQLVIVFIICLLYTSPSPRDV